MNVSSSKEYFEAIGAGWDRMREEFFAERVREEALAVAGVQAGAQAADLGAGTGFITEALLQRGVDVIAVDQSPAMLAALKQKVAGLGEATGVGKVDCREGEADVLPLVQIAAVTGIYGVSFAVVCVNAALAELWFTIREPERSGR